MGDDFVDASDRSHKTKYKKGTKVKILKVLNEPSNNKLGWYKIKYPDGTTDNANSDSLKINEQKAKDFDVNDKVKILKGKNKNTIGKIIRMNYVHWSGVPDVYVKLQSGNIVKTISPHKFLQKIK